MKFNRNIITVPVTKTGEAIKPVGKGSLFLTDHIELGTEKVVDVTVETTVEAAKRVARASRAAKARTQVAWMTHRINVGDRQLARGVRRDERKAAKAAKKVAEGLLQEQEAFEAHTADEATA